MNSGGLAILERPEILEDMERKNVELLDRLKIVKVSSEGGPLEDEIGSRPLPQMRHHYPPPIYGFEEPDIVSEGKCTLRQALEFITDHQNEPSSSKIDSIAKAHNMKICDVENIINNFRVFELYIPKNTKIDITKTVLKAMGAKKIIQPLFAGPFENIKPDINTTTTTEEKK